MRVLVLGATGMLGHRLVQDLSSSCHLATTTRRPDPVVEDYVRRVGADLFDGVDAADPASVVRVLDAWRPAVVINCIGIVKQLEEAKDPVRSIRINALFPHQLAAETGRRAMRLLHFSTDCVFSGHSGPYGENDTPDPLDLYGRSKLLGEVAEPNCLTLRTSIIGRELRGGHGLVEWFLRQGSGRVRGFRRALYSGLTTNVMARLVGRLLVDYPALSGIWQVSADAITKYDLLLHLKRAYGLDTVVEPDDDFTCDRRLDGTAFRQATGFEAPPWDSMVDEMARAGL